MAFKKSQSSPFLIKHRTQFHGKLKQISQTLWLKFGLKTETITPGKEYKIRLPSIGC